MRARIKTRSWAGLIKQEQLESGEGCAGESLNTPEFSSI